MRERKRKNYYKMIFRLDRERHKTGVSRDISFENLGDRSEYAFESLSVEFDAFERPLGHHRGRTRSVEQKRNLAEIVRRTQATHFHWLLVLTSLLIHGCVALLLLFFFKQVVLLLFFDKLIQI